MDLGPQLRNEGRLPARIRLHQSWYRAEVLGLPRWGCTPAPLRRPLGSILHVEDAEAGRSFASESARRLYLRRRGQGWGVDPVRIQGYLTSSQGLTINLLGPLFDEPEWAAHVMGEVLARPIVSVTDVGVEFAPPDRANFLGDMTRIDAVMTTTEADGTSGLVAFEIKLCDRWSSRYMDPENPRYLRPAETLRAWHLDSPEFRGLRVNQLLRCHLLASLVAARRGYTAPTRVLLLCMEGDLTSEDVAQTYRKSLVEPAHLEHCSLARFVSVMAATACTASQRQAASELHRRYVDLSGSEHLLVAG